MAATVYTDRKYQSILLKLLGRSSKLRLIDFFLDNPLSEFTKKEVIGALGINKQTLHEYFDELEQAGIVKVTRIIGKAKLYKINRQNEIVKHLINLDMALAKREMEKASEKYKKPVMMKSK